MNNKNCFRTLHEQKLNKNRSQEMEMLCENCLESFVDDVRYEMLGIVEKRFHEFIISSKDLRSFGQFLEAQLYAMLYWIFFPGTTGSIWLVNVFSKFKKLETKSRESLETQFHKSLKYNPCLMEQATCSQSTALY